MASLRCTPQKGQGHGEPSVFEPLGNVAAGCVLVASPDEIDHFSRHAVVLVLSHGAQGSRGVTLEMATAFNVGEMAASLADSPFAGLPLFRGGSAGKDQILMLHDVEGLRGSQPIGASGIHVGGLQGAYDAVAQGLLQPERFKFFFNQYEWVPGALEREISQGIWTAGAIPPELVLRQVGSQSERPLGIERKLGRIDQLSRDMSTPLWDILRASIPASSFAPTGGVHQRQDATARRGAPNLGEPAEGQRANDVAVDSSPYLSSLTRRELQALAKEYGVKGNLKSQDIVHLLLLKGFAPDTAGPVASKAVPEAVVPEAGDAAVGQRAMFLTMMVERVWEFRAALDAPALLPLLDAGAQVYGSTGANAIEGTLSAAWGDTSAATLNADSLRPMASGCVTYTMQYTDQSGKRVQQQEEMCFSMNGLLQTLRVL